MEAQNEMFVVWQEMKKDANKTILHARHRGFTFTNIYTHSDVFNTIRQMQKAQTLNAQTIRMSTSQNTDRIENVGFFPGSELARHPNDLNRD